MRLMSPRRFGAPLLAAAVSAVLATGAFAQDPLPYGPLPIPNPPPHMVVNDRTVALTAAALAKSADPGTRVQLVHDLGLAEAPAAHDAVAKALKDADELVRAEAVASLHGDSAVNTLIVDTSPVVRRAVAEGTKDPATLAKGYDDADLLVRTAAFNRSLSPETDTALAGKLATLKPPEQAIVCGTLATRKATAAAPSIAALLTSDSLVARVAAIKALGTIGTLQAKQLQAQLSHPHRAVRAAAVAALIALPAADRVPLAVAALNDADYAVRIAAVNILSDAGGAPAVPQIIAQLSLGDPDLRSAGRMALVKIAARDKDAAAALDSASVPLLDSPTATLRADGSFFLGALKSKTALPRHIALLNDADWLVVAQAATSLGQIGDASAAPPLAATAARAAAIGDSGYADWARKAAPDELTARGSAGEQAVLSCVALNYAPVVKAVKPIVLQKTASAPIRVAAVYAIGRLEAPSEAAPTLRTLLGRINDMEETQSVVYEAVKAAANAHATALEPALQTLAKNEFFEVHAVATIALDYLKGTHTPLEPPAGDTPAETMIRDLTPAAK